MLDRLAAAFDSLVCIAACSISSRESWVAVAPDCLAPDCSVSCRVVASDSTDRLAAMASDIIGFRGFSGYFSLIFVNRLLSSSRGRFSLSTVEDSAASFTASLRFTVTGTSINTFFPSMDIEEWR